jgi:hypothetical protein
VNDKPPRIKKKKQQYDYMDDEDPPDYFIHILIFIIVVVTAMTYWKMGTEGLKIAAFFLAIIPILAIIMALADRIGRIDYEDDEE